MARFTSAETVLEIVRTAPEAPSVDHTRLRTQAACVRTLCDEISRHKSEGRRFAALNDQLRDEVANLASILDEAPTREPPASSIRLRG
jgi:hypothetical protein